MVKENDKILALRKREAALRDVIAREKVRQQKKDNRDAARVASIIGAAIMDVCTNQPETVGVMVRQILAASSLRESERTFLTAKGWV